MVMVFSMIIDHNHSPKRRNIISGCIYIFINMRPTIGAVWQQVLRSFCTACATLHCPANSLGGFLFSNSKPRPEKFLNCNPLNRDVHRNKNE